MRRCGFEFSMAYHSHFLEADDTCIGSHQIVTDTPIPEADVKHILHAQRYSFNIVIDA